MFKVELKTWKEVIWWKYLHIGNYSAHSTLFFHSLIFTHKVNVNNNVFRILLSVKMRDLRTENPTSGVKPWMQRCSPWKTTKFGTLLIYHKIARLLGANGFSRRRQTSDENIHTFKACLVAYCFIQTQEILYEESLYSVAILKVMQLLFLYPHTMIMRYGK